MAKLMEATPTPGGASRRRAPGRRLDFDAGDFTDTPGSSDRDRHDLRVHDRLDGILRRASYSFEWPTITGPRRRRAQPMKNPGTCVPHDVHGDTTPTSEVADMGWAKAAAITYPTTSRRSRSPFFILRPFCTPSTRRRRGRGAIAGQHARRVHGPRQRRTTWSTRSHRCRAAATSTTSVLVLERRCTTPSRSPARS